MMSSRCHALTPILTVLLVVVSFGMYLLGPVRPNEPSAHANRPTTVQRKLEEGWADLVHMFALDTADYVRIDLMDVAGGHNFPVRVRAAEDLRGAVVEAAAMYGGAAGLIPLCLIARDGSQALVGISQNKGEGPFTLVVLRPRDGRPAWGVAEALGRDATGHPIEPAKLDINEVLEQLRQHLSRRGVPGTAPGAGPP